jgi:hypothetical protein
MIVPGTPPVPMQGDKMKNGHRRGRSRWRTSWHRAAAVAGVALLAASCAGTGSTIAAGSTNYQKAVAYAQCMRAHGAPRWPDPNSQGAFISTLANRADFRAPASANRACQHLLPNGGVLTPAQQQKVVSAGLKFAACMRAHGIVNFPDSARGPGFSQGQMAKLGIDPNLPQFETARRACQRPVPGVLP